MHQRGASEPLIPKACGMLPRCTLRGCLLNPSSRAWCRAMPSLYCLLLQPRSTSSTEALHGLARASNAEHRLRCMPGA